MRIRSEDDIDAELMDWLCGACAFASAKSRKPRGMAQPTR